MKVGKCQLPHCFVDRVSEAQGGMIRFTHGPPVSMFFKERNHMSVVLGCGLEIKQEGLATVDPEGESCK